MRLVINTHVTTRVENYLITADQTEQSVAGDVLQVEVKVVQQKHFKHKLNNK